MHKLLLVKNVDPNYWLVIAAFTLPFVIYAIGILISKRSKKATHTQQNQTKDEETQNTDLQTQTTENTEEENTQALEQTSDNIDDEIPKPQEVVQVEEKVEKPELKQKPAPKKSAWYKSFFKKHHKEPKRKRSRQSGGPVIRDYEPGLSGGSFDIADSGHRDDMPWQPDVKEPTFEDVGLQDRDQDIDVSAEPAIATTQTEERPPPKIVREAKPDTVAQVATEETLNEQVEDDVVQQEQTAPEVDTQIETKEEPEASISDEPSVQESVEPEPTVVAVEDKASETDTQDDKDSFINKFPSIDTEILNAHFYYVVRMAIPKGMTGITAIKMASTIVNKTGTKRYQVLFGYVAEDRNWEKPSPDSTYQYLIWAIPLSSRHSNINDKEKALIVRVVQDQMRRMEGVAEFPAHQDVNQRLEEVDKFCDDADLRLNFYLVSKEGGGQPSKVSDVIELACHEKMEEVNHRIVRMVNGEFWYALDAGEGEPLGGKSPDRRLARLMLWMDVPHVSNTESAFDEMSLLSRKLARVLNFSLELENGEPVTDEMLEETRAFIVNICAYMREKGVRPGSKLARALFT